VATRASIKRVVKAQPSTVFRIVCDPKMHVEIDGSGMLELAPNAKRLEAVGDTFEMDMDREPLGDVPMGKYQVLNTVTQIVPGSLLEWNVGSAEHGPFGHVYGWRMTAVDSEHTEVTNYCDWSGLPEKFRDTVQFPVVPVSMLEQSVEKLAALAEKGA
jgi:hypothetical protein